VTPGLAARRAAAALVTGVLARRRSLAEQAEDGPLAGLAPPERARAQALAAATLRHLGRIDALLSGLLDRPPPEAALTPLRLAVAEMHLDGVPAHAAVDAAVRLARERPKARHLPGLVNAVARRAADPARWQEAPEAGLPEWLEAPVRTAWGAPVAAAVAAAHLRVPPLDLTVKVRAEAPAWAAALGAELLPTGSVRLAGRPQVTALAGFAEGAWWVQDAAAALPVRLFGDLRGRSSLDLCAAPGGKTLQLAATGAAVTAVDASGVRLGRLRANLARTGLAAEVVAADALGWTPRRQFDAVLVDAPCSASGTIRRHPDVAHLGAGRDLGALTALQDALLARAWDWVAPGGRLVFCTCSLLPAEGEERVAAFRARAPDATVVAPDAAALGVEPAWVDAAGGLRLRPDYWPERGGMDGFYAACLARPPIGA
jgi:16S rRNA (cytosine967-C5)-methyltransferase